MKICKLLNTLFLFLIISFNFSCGSVKNFTYLQHNEGRIISDQDAKINSVKLKTIQYRLKPDDRLQVSFFSLTEEKVNFLKKPDIEVVVNDSGKIRIPVIGTVHISGLTIKEAEEKLKLVTSEYLKSPDITIRLLNFNITLLGEVNKQGIYNITESKINILSVIGQAGGLTDNANMRNIRILRNENDSTNLYKVNILDDNLLVSDKYFIKPNDIIIVDPLKAKSKNQQTLATVGLVVSILSSLIWIFRFR